MPDLLRHPNGTRGKVHEITPESAGWGYVGFTLYRLEPGDVAEELTGETEVILVLVEGKARVQAAGQDWGEMGERMDVFEKTPPHCLYVPNRSQWKAVATTACTIGVCTSPGKGNYPAQRLGPGGIELTPRGKGTNTRYVNNIA
ncbi:MAG: 5-deoxy-glucuronate isomerase, partial [Tabrizicola sp.]